MFGYVTANCTALTPDQIERYRGCYCGLCRAIYEKYGSLARLAVSYDMTFLILLLGSLTESGEETACDHCVTHPIKKQSSWSNDWTDYCADLSIILVWHNLDDAVRDGRKISGGTGRAVFDKAYKKACLLRPKEAALVAESMDRLRAIQDAPGSDPDAAAAEFGAMLGSLFCVGADRWSGVVYDMGDYLGRFIYMADAVCDLKKDVKSGNYNPLKKAYLDGERDFSAILSMLMAECAERFEVLPLVQDMPILRNILYSGVWQKLGQRRTSGKEGKT